MNDICLKYLKKEALYNLSITSIDCYILVKPRMHLLHCIHLGWDKLAKKGSFNDIKLIHKYGICGCTQQTLNYVASNGHLDILDYLYKNTNNKCSFIGLHRAIRHEHIHIVKYLIEQQNMAITKEMLNTSLNIGNFDIFEYLFEKRFRIKPYHHLK